MTKKKSKLTDKKGKSQAAFTAGKSTPVRDQEWQNLMARFDAYKASFRSDAAFEAETDRQLHELQMKGHRL